MERRQRSRQTAKRSTPLCPASVAHLLGKSTGIGLRFSRSWCHCSNSKSEISSTVDNIVCGPPKKFTFGSRYERSAHRRQLFPRSVGSHDRLDDRVNLG